MLKKTQHQKGGVTVQPKFFIGSFCVTILLASCATSAVTSDTLNALSKPSSSPLCQSQIAEIRADHKTARVNKCDVLSDTYFSLTVRPEKVTDPKGETINNSPWYGFRVDPKQAGSVKFELAYENGTHRYQPKISYDGVNWNALAGTETPRPRPEKFTFSVKSDGRPFFISAQEIFTPKAHDNWTETIAARPDVTSSIIGKSRNGYPLKMLEVKTEADVKKPYVVWVGRQHPPEVTGALALIPFTETVLNDSKLSKRFLKHFNILIVPMMNPDGVQDGNWRFNDGGMDLNRDWGPFTQPETRAVKQALTRFETKKDDIAFFLDFHSTWRNLLYTQTDEEPTNPPMFTKKWVEAVDRRLDDRVYTFTREPRAMSDRPISKNYIYENYGVPAITYEVGDATPRSAITESAQVFAEEMMRLLLEHETGE